MTDQLNCTESRNEVILQDNALVLANAITTIFISAGAIIANLLIITVFFKKKSLRNVNNVFLVQLAVVDFMKAVFILIPKVYTQLSRQCKIAIDYCELSGFISTIAFIHSALLLAAIALVRYFKMVKPTSFDKIFSNKKLKCYCLFLAVQTAIFGIVPIVGGGEYKYSPYHGVCFTDWSNKNHGFRITFYVYTIGICYVVILFSYIKIYLKLRAHNTATMTSLDVAKSMGHAKVEAKNHGMDGSSPIEGIQGSYRMRKEENCVEITQNSASYRSSTSKASEEVHDIVSEEDQGNIDDKGDVNQEHVVADTVETAQPDEARKNKKKCGEKGTNAERLSGCINNGVRKMIARKNKSESDVRSSRLYLNELKVTKIMFLIVIAYTVCWIPAFVINVVMFETNEKEGKGNSPAVNAHVLYWFITLVDFKVFINPMIYGFMNFQFRKEIKTLICKIFEY